MDMVRIFKALSNPIRLKILGWLKTPEEHFPPHQKVAGFEQGVCVAFIQQKAQLSQSTTSQYMIILHQAGLVIPTRVGKWTYYKRDEQMIAQFIQQLQQDL